MEAILLAGGLGTRLHAVTGDKYPKCLATVNNKPFLHYIIEDLLQQGVTRFIFAISHHAKMVKEEVSAHFSHIDCDFSVEEQPLGTGGAIKQALELAKSDNVLVFNADSFIEVNLKAFSQFCENHQAQLGLVCTHVDDLTRFGAAEINHERLVGFHEKGRSGEGFINAGVYYIDKQLPLLTMQPAKFSFEHNILAASEIDAFVFAVKGLFFDIGTPDDLHGASELVKLNAEIFSAS